MTSTTTTQPTASGLDFERVLPIFVLVFVDVLGLTVILPLLHLYAARFGASPLQIGLVVAAFPLAQLIGVPVMGALSDRYGRKPLLLISQITTCLAFVMLGLANSIELIILSRVIDGLFGANLATAQAALSDITDKNHRAQGLGLTGAAFGLGFIFGPTISILALELTDNMAIPALSAAAYSFFSILLTWFFFKETLPLEKRGSATLAVRRVLSPVVIWQMLRQPGVGVLLMLMFAQQVIFFGFESLMGLFTLGRLGLLGQANALIFLFIGFWLIMVQGRLIGKWTKRYGERRLIYLSLGLLAVGLIMFGLTPEQPHPFYVRRLAEFDLRAQSLSATEAMLGSMNVPLPVDGHNSLLGVLWLLVALVPLSIGAGLIRPCLNSLITRNVSEKAYGSVLGVSASFVSAADGIAPLLGGLIFQQVGISAPFLWGGILMVVLCAVSVWAIRPQPDEALA